MKKTTKPLFFAVALALGLISAGMSHAAATVDQPIVKLRALDKITARTLTFNARVGSTVKFGNIYIKAQACRKAPELENPEAASFLQVWAPEHNAEEEKTDSNWIFSGWMFASSPGLSSMDHPIYDVWVLDCLSTEKEEPTEVSETEENLREGEGEVSSGADEEPEQEPQEQAE